MHAVEEVAEVPYLLKEPIDYLMIPENGEQFTMSVRRHNFTGYFTQCYNRLESILNSDALRKGDVLSAESFLVDCKRMWNAALNKLKDDPYYFVDPV
jgi:aminoglycoside 3-N-acetyltransferase